MNQDQADRLIAEAMGQLNAMQEHYDARILAAVCLSKAQFLYRNLRQMGIETDDSLCKIFSLALNGALTDGEMAKVQDGEGRIISTTRN